MKKFCKAIYAALLDKLATILITVVVGGGMAACNHSKIVDAQKWIGEDLSRHTERMNQIESNAIDESKWTQFQIDDATKNLK